MPHGDFSDWAGIALLVGGTQQILYPQSLAGIHTVSAAVTACCNLVPTNKKVTCSECHESDS